ncbi:hypothetical protein L3Q82_001722 [Scortum barcoo]|uniref:Uncharacterized protein n=1 Tax=Scortum barcoo TaxID=214431 RepID=A0ACB8W4D7_9TELE|nr:hypothetical protein L3Q82_001722 [Scortum barcoo]
MSHREEASGKTQDTLEKLCLSAGLGTPRGPPGRAGGSVWDVIHTVGPVARGHVSPIETNDLTSCYQNSLRLMKEHGLSTVFSKLILDHHKMAKVHANSLPSMHCFQDHGQLGGFKLRGQHPGSSAIYSAGRDEVLPRQDPAATVPMHGFLTFTCLLMAALQCLQHGKAFPCISTGIYGFPNEPAAGIALNTVKNWIEENPDKMEFFIKALMDIKSNLKDTEPKYSGKSGTIPVVHIYQSQDRSATGPSGAARFAADYSQMGTMCLSEFVCQSGAVRETNPDWMARSEFAADAQTVLIAAQYQDDNSNEYHSRIEWGDKPGCAFQRLYVAWHAVQPQSAHVITRVIFCVFLETDFAIYKKKMSVIFQDNDMEVTEEQLKGDNTPPSTNSTTKEESEDSNRGKEETGDEEEGDNDAARNEDVEMASQNPDENYGNKEPNQEKSNDENENQDKDEDKGIEINKDEEDKGINNEEDKDEDKDKAEEQKSAAKTEDESTVEMEEEMKDRVESPEEPDSILTDSIQSKAGTANFPSVHTCEIEQL